MNLYEHAMGLAVEAKRLVKGIGGSRGFTMYLEDLEKKSKDELHEVQSIELSKHLKHAVENIPFYSDFKGKLELSPATAHSDIKEFPILSKKDVVDNFDKLVLPEGVRGRQYSGGGSTSGAVSVVRDKNEIVHSADEYFNRMVGLYPGKSRLLIQRAESVYYTENPKDKAISSNFLSRTSRVSPAFMDNERLLALYKLYKGSRPAFIIGITDPIYRFACFVRDSRLRAFPVEAVITGGQTMLPHYKDTIENVFHTKVYDCYGASEIGMLAQQCTEQKGLHYIPAIHHIEILDDNNNEVAPGEPGRFIITNMQKREMPIIRYDIEDLAMKNDELCSCGRNFPVINRFEGRVIESVVSPKHTYMTPLPFYEILSEFKNVDDFLIEQRGKSTVTVLLKMKSGKFSEVQQLALRKEINRYLDYPMKMEIEYISEITPMANGKVLRVRNLMGK